MKQQQAVMLCALTVAALQVGLLEVVRGENGWIDVMYVDPLTGEVDYGVCEGNALYMPPSTAQFRAEIRVVVAGATANGISAAEGFIEGLEFTGWDATFTPVEGTVLHGSFTHEHDSDGDTVPETRRGSLEFTGVTGPEPKDGCRCGDEGYVKLGDLLLEQSPATSPIPTDTLIRFAAGDAANPPEFNCAVVTLCDVPVFSKVCVDSGDFFINPRLLTCGYTRDPAFPGGLCKLTPVVRHDWSAIKTLFR